MSSWSLRALVLMRVGEAEGGWVGVDQVAAALELRRETVLHVVAELAVGGLLVAQYDLDGSTITTVRHPVAEAEEA